MTSSGKASGWLAVVSGLQILDQLHVLVPSALLNTHQNIDNTNVQVVM